jgi:hypothetical protein
MAQNLVATQDQKIRHISSNTSIDLSKDIPVFIKVELGSKKGSILMS